MKSNELLELIVTSSRISLQEAMLKKMASSRSHRKEIGDLLDIWIEDTWQAELLAWFLEYGEELRAKLISGPDIFALPTALNRTREPRWRQRMPRPR